MSREDILKLMSYRDTTIEVMDYQIGAAIKCGHNKHNLPDYESERDKAIKEKHELQTMLDLINKYEEEVKDNDLAEMIEAAEKSFGM